MEFLTFVDQSNNLQDQIWDDPKISESLRNLGILDKVDSMCAYVKQLQKSVDAWEEISSTNTMIIKFEDGPLDGWEAEHPSDGWESVSVLKVGDDLYRRERATHLKSGENIIATTHMLFRFTLDNTLYPGEIARLFPSQ